MEKLTSFQALGLSPNILSSLRHKGFEEPTPIQEKVIPLLLCGDKDLIGQAQTGTGKTAAFGLPIIEKIKVNNLTVQALILTPTRELTIQVAEEIHSLRGKKALKIVPLYGGQSIELQLKHLNKGVHLVVGTPGRILDHLRRKTLKLEHLDFCVLDEADEMLNMGFIDDVETILEYTNRNKRTMLFSATMPEEILRIAQKYMGPYELVQIKQKQLTVDQTDQIYFEVPLRDKFEALCRIIDIEKEFYGLVFCRTKVDVDNIANRLIDRGYDADGLHGDLSQAQREKIMNKFKKQRITLLVATDVAARGIDVQNLTHVINYALPQDPESYVHRIGRTGRAGKEGTAVTFITPEENRRLMFIQRIIKSKIQRRNLPQVKDIIEVKKKRIRTRLDDIIEAQDYSDYLSMAQDLLETNAPDEVLAALLKFTFQDELDASNYNDIRDVSPKIQGDTRLFIAKGKKDGMTKKSLAKFITEKVHITAAKIQDIYIQDTFSFITVPFREAELILKHFKTSLKGKKPIVVKAKSKS